MKQLLVLSGKGGTGKTTITRALIDLLQPEAYADCDVDAPNLHLVVQREGVPFESPYYGLDKAHINPQLCRGCSLCAQHCRFSAVVSGETHSINELACEGCGVCVEVCPQKAITLRPHVAGELRLFKENPVFSTAQLRTGNGNSGLLVSEVKSRMYKSVTHGKIAIIDGSPGIGCPVISSISGVDLVLIVAEPSLSGLSDLKRTLQTVRTFQIPMAICVNKWDLDKEKTKEIQTLSTEEGIPFVGTIPFDPAVVEANNTGKSIMSGTSKATTAVRSVVEQTFSLLMEGKR
jgi:MinD superfamily P-loop ATPase